MEKRTNKTNSSQAGNLLITHVFNAPREVVFKAWTDPEFLPRWYAPVGCTIRFEKLEIREGGEYLSCIHNPEFGDCWAVGVYREISFPNRLVYTVDVADENGERVEATTVGMDPEWPSKTVVIVTFDDFGSSKTKVTLHQTAPDYVAKRTGAHPSWVQMMERLNEIVAPKTA